MFVVQEDLNFAKNAAEGHSFDVRIAADGTPYLVITELLRTDSGSWHQRGQIQIPDTVLPRFVLALVKFPALLGGHRVDSPVITPAELPALTNGFQTTQV